MTEKALDGVPVPGLKGVVGGLSVILKNFQEKWGNEETLAELGREIERVLEIVRPFESSNPSQGLRVQPAMASRLAKFNNALHHYQGEFLAQVDKQTVRKHLNAGLIAEALKKLTQDIQFSIQTLLLEGQLHIEPIISDIHEQQISLHNHDLLKLLDPVKSAFHNAAGSPPGCLEGTRKALLKQVWDWFEDESPECPPVFWLYGLAGTGKSTIAHTVASKYYRERRLGASFFFSTENTERRRISGIVPTLAYQLALWRLDVRRSMCTAIKQNLNVANQIMQDQVETLLVTGLQNTVFTEALNHLLIVLDAFDECDEEDGHYGGDFLPLLIEALPRLPLRLKIFITSRPEQTIKKMFNRKPLRGPTHVFLLHEIKLAIVSADITLYLRHKLGLIALELMDGKDWPPEDHIKELVRRAGPLFIYASTVIKFLSHSSFPPQRQLNLILNDQIEALAQAQPFRNLDAVYQKVLDAVVSPDEAEIEAVCRRFHEVVGTILVLLEPLTVGQLSSILDIDQSEVEYALKPLESVLDIPIERDTRPIRIFHDSFPDVLTNTVRCQDVRFQVNPAQRHLRLANKCLSVIQMQLEAARNFDRPEDAQHRMIVRQKTCYALKHWLNHFISGITPRLSGGMAWRKDGIEYCEDMLCLMRLKSQHAHHAHIMELNSTTEGSPQCLASRGHVVMLTIQSDSECAALVFRQGSAEPQTVLLPDVNGSLLSEMRSLWLTMQASDGGETPIRSTIGDFHFIPRGRASRPEARILTSAKPARPAKEPGLVQKADLADEHSAKRPSAIVLGIVWQHIVEPILKALIINKKVGRQRPRLHWYLVGDLAFLPVHAAGQYTEQGMPLDCTADYVVSSYIPTLNALKVLRQQWTPVVTAQLFACIVAAPEVEGRAFLPAVTKEASIVSSYFTAEKQAVVSEVPSTLAALSTSHILHFAGHEQWSGHDPLEGELQLQDKVLSLEELMRPRPAPSILAFLNACSTTKRNSPSSALDILLCGFRSVVMSVGNVSDADGPVVAGAFYRSLLSKGQVDLDDIPHALDKAVQELRANGAPPERWAMFIHVGA